MLNLFPEIGRQARRLKPSRCVISYATDQALIPALRLLVEQGLITEPIFLAPRKLDGMKLFRKVSSMRDSAIMAHECRKNQEAELIIQGHEKRQPFISLHLDGGMLEPQAVYVAAFYDVRRRQTFFGIDPLVALAPTLENHIMRLNVVGPFMRHLLKRRIQAAALAPIETVNPKLPATISAAVLAQMSVRQQFGNFLEVSGPLDIDCALSKVAAQRKGVESKNSGSFDSYIFPDTNSAYFFATFLKYIGKVPTIGVLLSADRHLLLNSTPLTVSERVAEITLGLIANNFYKKTKQRGGYDSGN
ncbi:MAG TPA: hypothetical protein ENN66_01280 [Proteobacteria bacterium]|nr:hypothetical protein [Pseudomonadota bacterium]